MYNDINSQAGISQVGGLNAYFSKVYSWMFLGLFITAMTAMATIPMAKSFLHPVSFLILAIIELGMVFYLSARISKISLTQAIGLFLACFVWRKRALFSKENRMNPPPTSISPYGVKRRLLRVSPELRFGICSARHFFPSSTLPP